ncbi:MAG TPA: DUF349 domain-containing protein [Terrimesophilobacter sp.]|nr:DUF349 domain-containing protein [Terrimesophilobacter sp.]
MVDSQAPWGRVDDAGNVFVRTPDGERAVGQFPDATPEEALAYFERKFIELEGQVTLLEQRVKRGASASSVASTLSTLRDSIAEANAVGDLASLTTRLDALHGSVDKLTQEQEAEAKAAVEQAIADHTVIVEAAEALAAKDPAAVQWKKASAELDALFAQWKEAQQVGPRLPKSDRDALWTRFRAARTTIETARRSFFAELDATHKDVRARKQELIEKAEALSEKGVEGIGAYRALLDQWKAAGRAGKKADDALWAKFSAAGDVLYAAKAEQDAKDDAEFADNLTLKLALLDEAEPLLTETDRDAARAALLGIQKRWDEIGKVPRDSVRKVEDRLRKVEAAVRKLDEEHWQKNNPERKARSEGLADQLTEAIAKLESELAEAKSAGDDRRVKEATEALEARKSWLGAIG